MGNEFSLVECYLAPLRWRLAVMDVTLPRQGPAVMDYSARLFERSTFQASLNSLEREMHT